MVGIEATGIYAVAYQIGQVVDVILMSFRTAWTPWLYGMLSKEKSNKRKIVKLTYFLFVLILVATICFYYLSLQLMPYLVGSEFVGASYYMLWIIIGFSFRGMYYLVFNYITFVEKNKLLMSITLAIAVLNLLLNYILISRNGPIGAAQATAISFFAEFVICWLMCVKIFPMPWLLKNRGE